MCTRLLPPGAELGALAQEPRRAARCARSRAGLRRDRWDACGQAAASRGGWERGARGGGRRWMPVAERSALGRPFKRPFRESQVTPWGSPPGGHRGFCQRGCRCTGAGAPCGRSVGSGHAGACGLAIAVRMCARVCCRARWFVRALPGPRAWPPREASLPACPSRLPACHPGAAHTPACSSARPACLPAHPACLPACPSRCCAHAFLVPTHTSPPHLPLASRGLGCSQSPRPCCSDSPSPEGAGRLLRRRRRLERLEQADAERLEQADAASPRGHAACAPERGPFAPPGLPSPNLPGNSFRQPAWQLHGGNTMGQRQYSRQAATLLES
jgi:hypothetical protein